MPHCSMSWRVVACCGVSWAYLCWARCRRSAPGGATGTCCRIRPPSLRPVSWPRWTLSPHPSANVTGGGGHDTRIWGGVRLGGTRVCVAWAVPAGRLCSTYVHTRGGPRKGLHACAHVCAWGVGAVHKKACPRVCALRVRGVCVHMHACVHTACVRVGVCTPCARAFLCLRTRGCAHAHRRVCACACACMCVCVQKGGGVPQGHISGCEATRTHME